MAKAQTTNVAEDCTHPNELNYSTETPSYVLFAVHLRLQCLNYQLLYTLPCLQYNQIAATAPSPTGT